VGSSLRKKGFHRFMRGGGSSLRLNGRLSWRYDECRKIFTGVALTGQPTNSRQIASPPSFRCNLPTVSYSMGAPPLAGLGLPSCWAVATGAASGQAALFGR
jgi:hypothetical protein